jgi:hypothetical protein
MATLQIQAVTGNESATGLKMESLRRFRCVQQQVNSNKSGRTVTDPPNFLRF